MVEKRKGILMKEKRAHGTRMDLCRRARQDKGKERKGVRERGRNRVKGRVRKGETEVARGRRDKL